MVNQAQFYVSGTESLIVNRGKLSNMAYCMTLDHPINGSHVVYGTLKEVYHHNSSGVQSSQLFSDRALEIFPGSFIQFRQDTSPKGDDCVDVYIVSKNGITYDYAVILQPTSPFRLVEDIDKIIEKIIERDADSAFSMYEIEPSQHPMKVKKMEGDVVLSYCMEEKIGTHRQDFPAAYKRSGAVYVTKRDLIMRDNKLFGDFIVGHVVPVERSIDIDSFFDWIKAEYMLEDLKKRGYEF